MQMGRQKLEATNQTGLSNGTKEDLLGTNYLSNEDHDHSSRTIIKAKIGEARYPATALRPTEGPCPHSS